MKTFVILSLIFWIMNALLGVLLFFAAVADSSPESGSMGISGIIKFLISFFFIMCAIFALAWG